MLCYCRKAALAGQSAYCGQFYVILLLSEGKIETVGQSEALSWNMILELKRGTQNER